MTDHFMNGEQLIWQGRPSWRSMWPFYLKWGTTALLPLIVSVVVAVGADADSYWKWTAPASLAALALVLLVGALKRIDVKYRITTQRISIRKGILSKRQQGTHIKYIRGWDYEQSLLERMIDVGDVEFATASTDEQDSVFTFRGVRAPGSLIEQIDEFMAQRHDHDGE